MIPVVLNETSTWINLPRRIIGIFAACPYLRYHYVIIISKKCNWKLFMFYQKNILYTPPPQKKIIGEWFILFFFIVSFNEAMYFRTLDFRDDRTNLLSIHSYNYGFLREVVNLSVSFPNNLKISLVNYSAGRKQS